MPVRSGKRAPNGLQCRQCDTVIVSLPTLEIFRRALSGPEGLTRGEGHENAVNTCTVGVAFVREVS